MLTIAPVKTQSMHDTVYENELQFIALSICFIFTDPLDGDYFE
ncbi:5750_t:CDS:2 [Entrophospora sp. SA101]|nr:5750_t:CDS:2 [Entrophospora sp. SA101]